MEEQATNDLNLWAASQACSAGRGFETAEGLQTIGFDIAPGDL